MATDRQLVGWLTGRHPDSALAELLRRHGAVVYRTALRVTGNRHAAEDVSQAVFLLLVRKSKKLSRTRSLGKLLERLASAAVRDWLRSSGASRATADSAPEQVELTPSQVAAITAAAFGEARTSVQVLADDLEARLRRAAMLRLVLLAAAAVAIAILAALLLLAHLD